MHTSGIRTKVIAFVVIALVGVSYVGARYAGLDRFFGGGSVYVVKVRLADSGGLFANAEVTYRGVAVGRVGQLRLTEEGVEADLVIDRSTPGIPAEVDVVVANRSAIGEQYLDLRPKRDDGPLLTDGSVIEQSATRLPLPVETVLSNLDSMVASVPLDALRTVVNEMDTAFRDSGPNLQVLLDSSARFTRTATDYLPQTTRLIDDAKTVLDTQNRQADAIRSFSADLRRFAEQLRGSDADLRNLISVTPGLAAEVTLLLRESGPDLGLLLANLLTTAEVVSTRQDGMEHLLVAYPLLVGAGRTIVSPDGRARFGLVTTYFDPLPCRAGYEGTVYRKGTDMSEAPPVNPDARCALPDGHPSNVRGSRNAPKGVPVSGGGGPAGGVAVDLLRPPVGDTPPATLGTLLAVTGSGR